MKQYEAFDTDLHPYFHEDDNTDLHGNLSNNYFTKLNIIQKNIVTRIKNNNQRNAIDSYEACSTDINKHLIEKHQNINAKPNIHVNLNDIVNLDNAIKQHKNKFHINTYSGAKFNPDSIMKNYKMHSPAYIYLQHWIKNIQYMNFLV